MTPVFTPSRELREYMRDRIDATVRARPSFKNIEYWDGHVLVVERPAGPTRRCDRCDELKPLRQGFYSKRTRDGKVRITNTCRSCLNAARRENRNMNIERERAYWREYKARRRRGAA